MSGYTNQPAHPETAVQTREGRCPSCGRRAVFDFQGEQRWPQRVVEATGCPPTVLLWTCRACKTTLTDLNIRS